MEINSDKGLNRRVTPRRTWLPALVIATAALPYLGCASHGGILGVDKCADVPHGAIPEPVGTKLCQWQTAQVVGAEADKFALYRADFVGDSADLSPGALERLSRLIAVGAPMNHPITIEPSGETGLDQQRTETVVALLASTGFSTPKVQIAKPTTLGLSGPLAERVVGGFGRGQNAQPAQRGRANGAFNTGVGLPGGIF